MPVRPAPDVCWLYLIRHGSTANNVAIPPRLQGRRSDPPLSPEGREEARRTAAALAAGPLDLVVSSPLVRARQTAEAIAAPHGISVRTEEALTEVDVGDWEGWTWEEAQRVHPEAYRLFMSDAARYPYHGGESLSVVAERCVPAMRRLMEANLGRVVAVVSHKGVNRCYVAHLLNMPLARCRLLPQDNCGLTLLSLHQGEIGLRTINALDHLDGQ